MLSEAHIVSFTQELEKTAGPAILDTAKRVLGSPKLNKALGGLGSGLSLGATAGAGIGAIHGGVSGYREAKEYGEDTGHAVAHGVLRAGGGAVRGLGTGALIGGAAGAGMGATGRELSKSMPKAIQRVTDPISRFGQRQVHALTGWTPRGFLNPAGARDLRAGAYDAVEALKKAKTPAEKMDAKRYLKAAEEAEGLGLTSIPGFVKGMTQHPVKSMKAGLGEVWHSGNAGKALLALPALDAAYQMGKPDQPGGPGKAERVAKSLSQGVLAAPMPLAGNLALGIAAPAAAGRAGRLVDKMRKQPVQGYLSSPNSDASGHNLPVEYNYSNAAMGQLPESLVTS